MSKRHFGSGFIFVLMLAVLVLWTAPAMAQNSEGPSSPDPGSTEPIQPAGEPGSPDPDPAEPEDGGGADADNPPPYIDELVESSELTPEQVLQMRTDGAGWGNIKIATKLAEQMAADSADSDTPLTFDEALAAVLVARSEDTGFGVIAHENELKIGQLVRKRSQEQAGAAGDDPKPKGGVPAGEAAQSKGKKRGVLSRLAGVLGFGKAKHSVGGAAGRGDGVEKPEKPSRLRRGERPEKPEKPPKPQKLERPERPERPAKPEKPEKPERGPRR
ncbi:MAG: hypothetical protein ACYTAS_04375 [Planctomycetota bacterium]|jgi:hypothetical protein